MLSLAAMFAVLSYASPASAELKIGGDAAVRARGQFNNSETVNGSKTTSGDDLLFQYRVRLKASADLGSGYFFKALAQSEEAATQTAAQAAAGTPATTAGGWSGVGANNSGAYNLEVSNFYLGRSLENCHYSIGRLPLNSYNNPIFDLALYPVPTSTGIYAVDIPVATWNFDRVFGLNYGAKVGGGELNGTLVVLDNNSTTENTAGKTGDGLFNDGYLLHVTYKTTVGNVTVEPQAILALTDLQGPSYQKVSPNTFGLNATIPTGKSKVGLSGFYTVGKDSKAVTTVTTTSYLTGVPVVNSVQTPASVDYSGYLLRVKGESGSAMAWVDYNHTCDKSGVADVDYNNVFVWAQYSFKVQESATGTFSLTPTLRYRASGKEDTTGTARNNQLRTELYATVTF